MYKSVKWALGVAWAHVAMLAVVVLLLMACGGTSTAGSGSVFSSRVSDVVELERSIVRFHDDDKGVTCWIHGYDGIACIPDRWLEESK